MKTRLSHMLGPLFGLMLFVAALGVMHHELRTYHFHDIVRHLEELPSHRLLWGLLFTVLSYLIMTGYDALALRYIRHPLSYGKIGLASFIGYAFSNNIGLSMIAGGSVRFRLYSNWGLSALEITQVVAFCSLTFWLGFLTLGGMLFLLVPISIPEGLHLPFVSVQPLGVIFVALVVVYLLWTGLKKTPLRIGRWEFPVPSTHLFLAQTAVAVLDWVLAASVLYSLLPDSPQLSYPKFLSIYLLAQMAGLASQVPGGLGVFEAVSLILLSPTFPASAVLGSLLAYRGLYYLLPLGVAAVLLGTQEVLQKKGSIQTYARIFGQRVSGLVPQILAFTTFVGGAILLFSGAIPVVSWRLAWLKNLLPLSVVEVSHFLASVVGMGLLLLARGLERKLDAAYVLTIALLCSGILFSLLKGLDYEQGIALSVLLVTLLPCRNHFYRKASLFNQRFSPGWIAAIIIVLLCSLWLGIFSYKHVEYSGDLWWRFTFSGNAPRFLRAMVGASGVALFFAIARLLRPSPHTPALPGEEELERVSSIVRRSPQTYTNLALLGDKALLFNEKRNTFIMYGIEGRSWVALRDPVGPKEEWAELIWRFEEICDRYDGWPIFYEVSKECLPLYQEFGFALLKLGEEASVSLQTFSLEGGGTHRGLRRTQRKLEKLGCLLEVVPPERISPLLPELKTISDAWLAQKKTQEKRFSLGFFDENYLRRFPLGIIRKEGNIIAFANIWLGAEKEEISSDLMRYDPSAPRDVMEYLFIQLMLWGKQQGYRWFNLGMAPLSGLEDHSLAPVWNRLGTFIFRHGEHFYNFQGLRQYKEKFGPRWEPKYLASPGGLVLPRILANIGTLICGGLKGMVSK